MAFVLLLRPFLQLGHIRAATPVLASVSSVNWMDTRLLRE